MFHNNDKSLYMAEYRRQREVELFPHKQRSIHHIRVGGGAPSAEAEAEYRHSATQGFLKAERRGS